MLKAQTRELIKGHRHLWNGRDHPQFGQVVKYLEQRLARVDEAVPAQLARLVHAMMMVILSMLPRQSKVESEHSPEV